MNPLTFHLRLLALPIFIALQSPSSAQTPSPTTTTPRKGTVLSGVHASEGALNLTQELQIGQEAAQELYNDPQLIQDALLQSYTDHILARLLTQAYKDNKLGQAVYDRFKWQSFLLNDQRVNAFAVPGGYFGINLGLISIAHTQDALASVLAHELTHVTQHHVSRLMNKQEQQLPILLAGAALMVFAARTDATSSADLAGAASIGSQALTLQQQLKFSREMEREADRLGFELMQQAGYSPQGAVDMFETMQKANHLNDNGDYPYLRTHPLTTERIGDMQIRSLSLQKNPTATQHSLQSMQTQLTHDLLAARAKSLATIDLTQHKQIVHSASNRQLSILSQNKKIVSSYVALLSAIRLKNYEQGVRLSQTLFNSVQPNTTSALLAQLAHCQLLLTQYNDQQLPSRAPLESALQKLRSVEVTESANFTQDALVLMQGQLLLALQKNDESVQLLQTYINQHPKFLQGFELLAQALNAQGKTSSANRALAQVQTLKFNWQGAIDRLKAARDSLDQSRQDIIEESIIDTEIKRLESLQKERQKENS